MFSFDTSALPHLSTRKALLAIDFQNDFLAKDGALPVTDPDGFVDRTLQLSATFRKSGDVVWVCTEFDKNRPAASEKILANDEIPKPSALAARIRRRTPPAAEDPASGADADRDPEAFLSQGGPLCVRSGSPGAQVPQAVKDAVAPQDITFIKSHYSAFKSGQLLQMLRGKFVTELYLCGSLANIGVYATAVDAAMYGYSITVVEDCCGYRSDLRQSSAIRSLVDMTGCEVVDADQVVEQLQPKPPKPKPSASSPSPRAVSRRVGGLGGSKTPPVRSPAESSDLDEKLARLTLAGASAAPQDQPQNPEPLQPVVASPSRQLEVDPAAQPSSPSPPPSPSANESLGKEASRTISVDEPPIKGKQADNRAGTASTRAAVPEPILLPASPRESSDSKSDSVPQKPAAKAETMAPHATEPLCEGDTHIIHNVLSAKLADGIFEKLRDEIRWQRMSHQGGDVPRLVAVQGAVASDGSMPVYRHPADESPPLLPFSPTVTDIKTEVEKQLGHPLNHVLIQFYRDGNDYISEHSDKTLDIVPGSFIANVSLGAERTMVFRTKRQDKDPSKTEPSSEDLKRKVSRANLPHNSLCRMGLATNMRWLHAIRQDKRAEREKSPMEIAYSGGRISLTFRRIGTFLDRDSTLIWGQGATGKTLEEAHAVINGQTPEAIGMLRAFGTENHSSQFDWNKHYGEGFDVLHISNAARLFTSSDPVINMRIALMLAEYGIGYARGSMSPTFNWKDGNPASKDTPAVPESLPIKFVDNDHAKSVVQGDIAIMLYLDAVYGSGKANDAVQAELARRFSRFQQALSLLDRWRGLERVSENKPNLKPLKRELAVWDGYAAEAGFIVGATVSLADFAVWPVLHDIVERLGLAAFDGTESLKQYYETFKEREAVAKVLSTAQTASSS